MAKILEILIEKVKRAQKLAFYFIVCVCVYFCMCYAHLLRGQRTTCEGWSSLTVWVLG